jgi:hypothetical protein
MPGGFDEIATELARQDNGPDKRPPLTVAVSKDDGKTW